MNEQPSIANATREIGHVREDKARRVDSYYQLRPSSLSYLDTFGTELCRISMSQCEHGTPNFTVKCTDLIKLIADNYGNNFGGGGGYLTGPSLFGSGGASPGGPERVGLIVS